MAAIHKKVFTSQKGLRSTGGPDLLKWGLPGGGIKSAKVAPTPYVYFPPEGQVAGKGGAPLGGGRRQRAVLAPSRPVLAGDQESQEAGKGGAPSGF